METPRVDVERFRQRVDETCSPEGLLGTSMEFVNAIGDLKREGRLLTGQFALLERSRFLEGRIDRMERLVSDLTAAAHLALGNVSASCDLASKARRSGDDITGFRCSWDRDGVSASPLLQSTSAGCSQLKNELSNFTRTTIKEYVSEGVWTVEAEREIGSPPVARIGEFTVDLGPLRIDVTGLKMAGERALEAAEKLATGVSEACSCDRLDRE